MLLLERYNRCPIEKFIELALTLFFKRQRHRKLSWLNKDSDKDQSQFDELFKLTPVISNFTHARYYFLCVKPIYRWTNHSYFYYQNFYLRKNTLLTKHFFVQNYNQIGVNLMLSTSLIQKYEKLHT
jgi:hypothetical protein